ncbi:MAG TPA: hypothetical protein ENN20_05020 [Candidatus Marinimicrobia bacterium]|nr:hypothetical protein [Candidatus Neomarinimicrobiota bacterium]
MKTIKYFLILMLVSTTVFAQYYLNPVSTSLAGAYATKARGAYINGWNPANLGLENNPRFSLHFGFLPLVPFPTVQISNSAISPFLMNKHFFTGGYLTDQDKEDLIAFFPDDGLSVNPLMQLPILNLSFGRWAVSIGTEVTGVVTLPKSLFRFAFFGNEFEKPLLDLENTNVEMQAVTSVALAHGREVTIPVLSDVVEQTTVGAAIKVLIGGGYTGFEQVAGTVTSYPDKIVLDGNLKGLMGIGGYGAAFDLGLATVINEKMSANISLHNLFGFINWGMIEAEKVEYSIYSEIYSEDFENFDSALEEGIQTDTSYSVSGFTSNYPSYLLLGFEYRILDNLNAYATVKQHFSNDLAATYLPKVSIAAEYDITHWFPARLGFSFGGIEKFQWGIGTGLNFSHYALDIGFSQIGGMFNHAKGFAISFGQSILF